MKRSSFYTDKVGFVKVADNELAGNSFGGRSCLTKIARQLLCSRNQYPVQVKHPLVQSIREVLRGFLATM